MGIRMPKGFIMFKGFKRPVRRSYSQEVQDVPPGTILIQLYGDVDTPDAQCLIRVHHPERVYMAEELCMIAARERSISPLALHLFALVTPDHARWLPPNEKVTCPETGHIRFLFRMRIKPDMHHLLSPTFRPEAFDYIFLQIRDDFVNDVLQESLCDLGRELILGLGVMDMHRWGKEKGLPLEKVTDENPAHFLPKSIADNFKIIWRLMLKNGFRSELKKVYSSDESPVKLKFQYMNGVLQYVPNYAIEPFLLKDIVDEIVIDPFDKKIPGIYIKGNNDKEHVCKMDDILDVSFLAEDARVQINRCYQPPRILEFCSTDEGRSFVALVDSYLRLTKNFYFDVCPSAVQSPMVEMLRRNRFHGPVSADWAKIQLLDYNKKNPDTNYLVRQQSQSLDNLVLVFVKLVDQQPKANQLMINKLQPNGGYQVALPNENIFESVSELLRHYESGQNPLIPLKKRLLPAMVQGSDESGLFLCKAPHIEEEDEEGKSDMEHEVITRRSKIPQVQQQQRSHLRIVSAVRTQPKAIGAGRFTEVYKGLSTKDSRDVEVAVKQLKRSCEKGIMYQALMEMAHTMAFWSTPTIITVHDICLQRFQVLEEWAAFGSLELYLRNPHQTIYIQHLVTAAEQISQALRYLQDECRNESLKVHGNLRARNILVFDHTEHNMKVKLADPGMLRAYAAESIDHDINLERLPWLAPELYKMLHNTTVYTDRFAFGTTLWELFSLGDRPFLHINIDFIKWMVHTGKYLDRPQKCPQELYALMQKCWTVNPAERIPPNEIVRDILNISLRLDHRPAGSHYSVENMGDPPKQFSFTDATSQHVSSAVASLPAGQLGVSGVGSTDGTIPANMTVNTNSTVPIWALNDTDVVKNRTEGRPLPDQPGIEYILLRKLLKVDSMQQIGQGYYGKVHVGKYNGESVAVKSLHRNITQNHTDFENELKMMIKLKKHQNVVSIIGQCPQRGPTEPMLLVMEYVENGCLRNYLRKRLNNIDSKTLLRFCQQVAEGMLYLSSMKIVHRDLAARNVLVAKDITMKISDFGLSRLIDPNRNYYKCGKSAEMPLKWCAPESLLYQKFSTKSDVWSYGITCWEIFQFGEAPVLCEEKHIHTELYNGKRLVCPPACPHPVYSQLILCCWEYDPNNRHNFKHLSEISCALLDQADVGQPGSAAAVDVVHVPGRSLGVE